MRNKDLEERPGQLREGEVSDVSDRLLDPSFLPDSPACLIAEESAVSAQQVVTLLAETRDVASTELGVVMVPLGVETDEPFRVFEKYVGHAFSVSSRRLTEQISVHRISHHTRRSDDNRFLEGHFMCLQLQEAWFAAMTHQDLVHGQNLSDFRDLCLLPWIELFYPGLHRMRIRARTILLHLQNLHERSGTDLVVLRADIRLRNGHMHIEQPEGVDVLAERLERERAHLDGATYRVSGEVSYEATCRRDGLLYYHRGDFNACLAQWLLLLGHEKGLDEVLEKALQQDTPGAVGAVDIGFVESLAPSVAASGDALVRILDSGSRHTASVLHGNPYLHFSVFDLVNGSAFTVFSCGRGIRILPGRNASKAALSNLLGVISQHFLEVESVTAKTLSVADTPHE